MPQMGWPSVAHEPARCPEQAGVTASWLRTSRDRDDPSICKAACSGGAATPEQGGVTATWPLASRDRAYPSISAAACSGVYEAPTRRLLYAACGCKQSDQRNVQACDSKLTYQQIAAGNLHTVLLR